MFVYHLVDPDLRVKIIFRKEGTAEYGGTDFEIGDIGISAHCYWSLKKISYRASLLLYYFFGDKKWLLKALLPCTFICSLLISFDLPSYSSQLRKRYTLRLLLCYVYRSAGGRVFLFSWERLGRGL